MPKLDERNYSIASGYPVDGLQRGRSFFTLKTGSKK